MNLIFTTSNRDCWAELKTILATTGLKYNIPNDDYFDVNFEVKDADEANALQQDLVNNVFGARIPGQFYTQE